MDIKQLFGVIGVLLSVAGYWAYISGIFHGKIKPHAYTWLVFSTMGIVGAYSQIRGDAGAGAWVTIVMAMVSVFVFVLSLKMGEKRITLTDKLSLTAAISAMLMMFFIGRPLLSVMMIVTIDCLALYPTLRKSWSKPYQESIFSYSAAGLKFIFALLAVEGSNILAWLYPAYLVSANFATVTFLAWRRHLLKNSPQ